VESRFGKKKQESGIGQISFRLLLENQIDVLKVGIHGYVELEMQI
jgi:hypothetical protein